MQEKRIKFYLLLILLLLLVSSKYTLAQTAADLTFKASTITSGNSAVLTGSNINSISPTTLPGTGSLIDANTANQTQIVSSAAAQNLLMNNLSNLGSFSAVTPVNGTYSMLNGASNNITSIVASTNQISDTDRLTLATQSAIIASHVTDSTNATVLAAQAKGIQTDTIGNKVIDTSNGKEVIGDPKSLTIIQSDGTSVSIQPTDEQIKNSNDLAKASGINQEYVKTEQVVTYDQRPIQTSNPTDTSTSTLCNASTGLCTYTLMAPISGLFGGSDGKYVIKKDDKSGLCLLLNSWFRIGIALAGLLAVVMIVLGGFQYATTDSLFDKSEGKGKIQNALWGLLLALSTWLVIYTINPDLTSCDINAKAVTLSQMSTAVSGSGALGSDIMSLGMLGASNALSAAGTSQGGGGNTLDQSGASIADLSSLDKGYYSNAPVDSISDVKPDGGVEVSNAGVRVDSDGVTPPSYSDPTRQSQTSYQPNGQSLDATKDAYVVVPGGSGIPMGTPVLVQDQTSGKQIWAVVGDTGPVKNGYGEMSTYAATQLGASSGKSDSAANHNVTFTFYPKNK